MWLRQGIDPGAGSLRLVERLPNLKGVGSALGRNERYISVVVDASTRREAEELALADVAAALGNDAVDYVEGDDDLMQDRQVLLWAVGARRQIRRWEIIVAEIVRAGFTNHNNAPSALHWLVEIERHFALLAVNHLRLAVKSADGRYTKMRSGMAANIENHRDLHEHWDEQRSAFYNRENPGPLRQSGKTFAARHPGRSPYSPYNWSSATGPELGAGIGLADVEDYLGVIQREVLTLRPELGRFLVPLEPSPWVGPDTSPDEPWWPKKLP